MSKSYIFIFELLWILFIAIICFLVFLPFQKYWSVYPFTAINILFIVTTLYLIKHCFFTKYSFFAKWQKVKITLVVLCIPLIFKLVEFINYFITYIDENAFDSFMDLPAGRIAGLSKYIYNEMLFFGVAAVVTTIYFALRMIVSAWRWHNLKKV